MIESLGLILTASAPRSGGRSGSFFRLHGPLSGSRFGTLRRTAGLRTLPDQNNRPEADDRNADACETGGPPR